MIDYIIARLRSPLAEMRVIIETINEITDVVYLVTSQSVPSTDPITHGGKMQF